MVTERSLGKLLISAALMPSYELLSPTPVVALDGFPRQGHTAESLNDSLGFGISVATFLFT